MNITSILWFQSEIAKEGSKWSDKIFTEYGLAMLLAVSFGFVFLYLFIRKSNSYQELVSKLIESQTKLVSLMGQIEARLSDQQGMSTNVTEIKGDVKDIKSHSTTILSKVQNINN